MANVVSNLQGYADILVLCVAAFLYVTDFGKLLFVNELLFAGAVGVRPSVKLAESGMELGGRYAHFPLALTPGAIVLRATWPVVAQTTTDTARVITGLDRCMTALRVPRVMCTLILPQLFIGIPLLYWLAGSEEAILLLLFVYLQTAVLLLWLAVKWRQLGLSGWQALGLGFESLVCIPYAANLHRKLADKMLAKIGHVDGEALAAAILPTNDFADLRSRLAAASATRLLNEPPESAAYPGLQRLAEDSVTTDGS